MNIRVAPTGSEAGDDAAIGAAVEKVVAAGGGTVTFEAGYFYVPCVIPLPPGMKLKASRPRKRKRK